MLSLLFYFKMMLRIISAIKFYPYHKFKYAHTQWECEWKEEQSKLSSLDKKRHEFANFQSNIFKRLPFIQNSPNTK